MALLRKAILCLLALVFNPTPAHAAIYSAGVISKVTLHDNARRRDIPLLIYYPKTKQPARFPVIVFSHGAGGARDGYDFLGRYWAERGYVVIHPTHIGTDRSKLKRGRPLVNLKTIKDMMRDPESFVKRPQDITFILNSLPQLSETLPQLQNRMDPTRVGVGGHSLGAYTALAVAGSVVYPPKQGKRVFGDTRPLAYLALSPQGARDGAGPFHSDSWTPVARPVFLVTGTEDKGLGNEPAPWRTEAFKGLRPGHKYLAVVRGANHMDFAGTQLDGTIRDAAVHKWLQRSTTLYWNAYLKRDPEALAKLRSEGWPKVEGVKVRGEMK